MTQVRVLKKGISPTIYYHQECKQCEALLEIKDDGKNKFKCPECAYDNVLNKNSEKVCRYERDKLDKLEEHTNKEVERCDECGHEGISERVHGRKLCISCYLKSCDKCGSCKVEKSCVPTSDSSTGSSVWYKMTKKCYTCGHLDEYEATH